MGGKEEFGVRPGKDWPLIPNPLFFFLSFFFHTVYLSDLLETNETKQKISGCGGWGWGWVGGWRGV